MLVHQRVRNIMKHYEALWSTINHYSPSFTTISHDFFEPWSQIPRLVEEKKAVKFIPAPWANWISKDRNLSPDFSIGMFLWESRWYDWWIFPLFLSLTKKSLVKFPDFSAGRSFMGSEKNPTKHLRWTWCSPPRRLEEGFLLVDQISLSLCI